MIDHDFSSTFGTGIMVTMIRPSSNQKEEIHRALHRISLKIVIESEKAKKLAREQREARSLERKKLKKKKKQQKRDK